MSFEKAKHRLLELNSTRFDFNLEFEQLFFSIVPSALFIVAATWRTSVQIPKPKIVHAPVFQWIKIGLIVIYGCLVLALVVLASNGSLHVTTMFIAAAVLRLVVALVMIPLSAVDHSRCKKPSILLTSYLTISLALAAVQTRTLFLCSSTSFEYAYSGLFCAALAVKTIILLLESQQKTKWVQWDNNEKEHSPEETSGIFSLASYFWMNKLFHAGHRTTLTVETLLPLDSSIDSKELSTKFSQCINRATLKHDKLAVTKALVLTLKAPLLLPILPRLAQLGFTICQPLFMERLLQYLSEPRTSQNIGYGLIGASFLIYLGITVSGAYTWYYHHRLRIILRSVLVPAIFIKATQGLSGMTDDNMALTLMSTDMERITAGFRTLHETWACIVQVSLAAWMLYKRLGVVFIVPIGVVILCTIGLGILMRFIGNAQKAWMAQAQKRVGLTATVIASMKNLKISGLTIAVRDFVQKMRLHELAAASHFRVILIVAALFGFTPILISPPLTFAFAQQKLDAPTIFSSLTFLTLLTGPLSDVFQSIPNLVSAFTCLGRIQKFLGSESREDFRRDVAEMNDDKTKDLGMLVEHGYFGWEENKHILKDINIRIVESSLTAIIGPIGAGKSTLCKALLGEAPFHKGNVRIRQNFTRVGYCEQSALLFNGSIRENIVGFSTFNSERYVEVINATALALDFGTLPKGDDTNVGSNGITLSGGQKQRVALARALYLSCDLLILDDIFSGLDADTEEHIFRNVFSSDGLLRKRGSTVILSTHSLKHLSAMDYIIALNEGNIEEQGSFEKLVVDDGYVRRLGLKTALENTDVSSGAMLPIKEPSEPEPDKMTRLMTPDITTEDVSRRVGDRTVYKHYIASMGIHLAAFSLFFATLWGFFTNFPTVWLTFWSNDVMSPHSTHSHSYYAGVYAVLQVCAMFSLLALGICLWIVALVRAGSKLHQEILTTLVHAPLRFFTITDTGVVTNLFSQDLNLVDTELPQAALSTLFCIFQALGQAAVMVISSAYLGIAYPFLLVVLAIMARYYLRTSRQLRLLDLEAKSPLYTHFLDTVKGVVTLRAFGFIPEEIEKNARLVDTSQRPAYFQLMTQEWLNIILGFITMVIAVVMVTLSTQLRTNSALTGASLFSLIALGENLSGIVVFWTRLETCLGAVARLKTFNDEVKPEDKNTEDVIPPESWPQKGAVELNGVSATYEEEDQPSGSCKLALQDIRLGIRAGEKVAICGRTGSGKSSLVAMLLKLLDPISSATESVIIDGIPLHRINRSVVRQRLIAIPQEAVFLPDGTDFQINLDPSGTSTTEDCESVLEIVGLSQFVHDRGGLGADLNASTLSAGQQQLFSVARAILRNRIRGRYADSEQYGGILLLDEVSSSVDVETEHLMQDIIKTEFEMYTVIAVSHRLQMIMDYDKVVVMSLGQIAELGSPAELSRQPGSRFAELIRAAGAI